MRGKPEDKSLAAGTLQKANQAGCVSKLRIAPAWFLLRM